MGKARPDFWLVLSLHSASQTSTCIDPEKLGDVFDKKTFGG